MNDVCERIEKVLVLHHGSAPARLVAEIEKVLNRADVVDCDDENLRDEVTNIVWLFFPQGDNATITAEALLFHLDPRSNPVH